MSSRHTGAAMGAEAEARCRGTEEAPGDGRTAACDQSRATRRTVPFALQARRGGGPEALGGDRGALKGRTTTLDARRGADRCHTGGHVPATMRPLPRGPRPGLRGRAQTHAETQNGTGDTTAT